jgi:anti-sigma factor RsiW
MTGAELTCAALVELVTEYLEGALDADTTAVVEEHLAICPGCGTYLDQMRATLGALGHVPVDTLPARAQADLLAAFRGFHAGPAAPDPAASDPAAPDPAASDPAAPDPAASGPAASGPAASDPAAPDHTS